MKSRMRFSFCRGDLIAIVLVSALAIGFGIGRDAGEELSVQVYHEGALVRELPLQKDADFKINGRYSNTVCIKDGRAAIVESDCPGEDCVHSGWIRDGGRSVVCLPNRVEVRIVGASDVDFVVG